MRVPHLRGLVADFCALQTSHSSLTMKSLQNERHPSHRCTRRVALRRALAAVTRFEPRQTKMRTT